MIYGKCPEDTDRQGEWRSRRRLLTGGLSLAAACSTSALFAQASKLTFKAAKTSVKNRGKAPDAFLFEMVTWAQGADDQLFAPNGVTDVYASVLPVLGPWTDIKHRKAVMLEVMRVLAGFESSWRWSAGVDITNPTSVTPSTIEAGAWQVSANSLHFGNDLKQLVLAKVGSTDGNAFQAAIKSDHALAMEYVVRLLRHTVRHNGPIKRHEIDPWLRRDAVEEFRGML